jgi:ABC-type nitrate/sulfonate/bicarbonate transport system permease component
MSIVKLLAAYTFVAMATGVIAAILLVNKNFDMRPVIALTALLTAVPVLALAVLAMSNRQQGY